MAQKNHRHLLRDTNLMPHVKDKCEQAGITYCDELASLPHRKAISMGLYGPQDAKYVRHELKRVGTQIPNHSGGPTVRRHDWTRVDWGLPTSTIAKDMDAQTSDVSTYRCRYHSRSRAQETGQIPHHEWVQRYTFSPAKLRQWRTVRGWSGEQMRIWMGLGRNTYYDWENGHRVPDAINALRLCLLLDLHPRDLCERKENDEP